MLYPVDHKFKETDIVFSLTVAHLQDYAQEFLERQLTTDEIIEAMDKLDDGIHANLDEIVHAVLDVIIE